MKVWLKRSFFGLAVLAIGFYALAAAHAVDTEVTAEDEEYLAKIYGEEVPRPRAMTSSLAGELAVISQVQRAVLRIAPVNGGIPQGLTREPKDLFGTRKGLCYDRSRTIEKSLRSLGFETRHVYIYSLTGPEALPILKPGVTSHAVTEVRTREGWMVVDSNFPWIAFTNDGRPMGMAEVRADVGVGQLHWAAPFEGHQNIIYREPFRHLFGVYSRHGRFYPPFNPFPDINWSELMTHFD
jgi:hypothetical protein